jgi:hypothetical protein
MKTLLIAAMACFCSIPVFGQGTLNFNNFVPGLVDAKVYFVEIAQAVTDDQPTMGKRWEAQLFGGPEGGGLMALFPTTTFKAAGQAGYVVPVEVTVPNVQAGERASVRMNVFARDGTGSGYSRVFTVTVGGGGLPPANLTGLESFGVVVPPEPSTILLVAVGVAFLIFSRRRSV